MTKAEKFAVLHEVVATHLCHIEDDLHKLGLTAISALTLIARDPTDPGMVVCLTNDDLAAACQAALAVDEGKLPGARG